MAGMPSGVDTEAWTTPERVALRALAADFTRREILGELAAWEAAGEVPRALHARAAAAGLLGAGFPTAVGGSGGDLRDTVTITEEIIGAGGSTGLVAALFTHGIALPHLVAAGEAAQLERFVRPVLAGRQIAALAVTEPAGGSDVANLRTRAVQDGADYVVDGVKTYITSGVRADFYTVAVRTGAPGHAGLSLLVVERDTPGVVVRPLEKLGWWCSDTAEIAFTGARVPVANRIGPEGSGFAALMRHFVTERVSLAVSAYATAARCLALTLDWSRSRRTFGRELAARSVTRHALVETARQVEVARTYTRAVVDAHVGGRDVVAEACLAKNTAVAACEHAVTQAVRLHGGLGCMRGSEVERHYRDAAILGIGGGASEVLADFVARRWGFGPAAGPPGAADKQP